MPKISISRVKKFLLNSVIKDIIYDERSLDNIAMALAAEGYANKMRGASLINIKENGHILIGDKTPELRTASVDMQKAAVI